MTRDLWYDPLFAAYHVSPVLHSFLSIEHGSIFDDLAIRQKECFRLAGILYLCNLRSKFDFEPGAGMLYGTKIQMMLGTPYMLPYWGKANIFLMWIMTVCACSPILLKIPGINSPCCCQSVYRLLALLYLPISRPRSKRLFGVMRRLAKFFMTWSLSYKYKALFRLLASLVLYSRWCCDVNTSHSDPIVQAEPTTKVAKKGP